MNTPTAEEELVLPHRCHSIETISRAKGNRVKVWKYEKVMRRESS